MTEKELREKAEKNIGFRHHLMIYIVVCIGLFAFDYLNDKHLTWAYFAALGWGVGIFSHYISIKSGGIFSVEKEMQRLRKSED